ncbi:signal peptidase I, partial [Vibrio ponticus]
IKYFFSFDLFLVSMFFQFLIVMFLFFSGFFVSVKAKNTSEFKYPLVWLNTVLLLMLYIFPVSTLEVMQGQGVSMEPTVSEDNIIFLIKLSEQDQISRDDLVSFERDLDIPYMKRVVGLPKDRLEIDGDRIYINSKLVGYILDKKHQRTLMTEIPEGSYFVLGDNPVNSIDSREFEEIYINRMAIKSKVLGYL